MTEPRDQLRRIADATNPGQDPVSVREVMDRSSRAPTARRGRPVVAAAAVILMALVIGAGILAGAQRPQDSGVLEQPESSTVSAPPTTSTPSTTIESALTEDRIVELARTFAAEARYPDPDSIRWVRSVERSAATRILGRDSSRLYDPTPVALVAMEGSFDGAFALTRDDDGYGLPPSASQGRAIYFTIAEHDGDVLDLLVVDRIYDLSELGVVEGPD